MNIVDIRSRFPAVPSNHLIVLSPGTVPGWSQPERS